MARVLLVEDNPLSSDMLSRRLRRRGFWVDVAENGFQGVNVAAAGAPDVILMDLSMPLLDGWSAIEALKGCAATRHIPIIAITSHTNEDSRVRAESVGCDAYHTKPVDFGQLVTKIRNLLSSEHPFARLA